MAISHLSAKYIGPPIFLYESYKQSDVIVTVHYTDGRLDYVLPSNEFTVSTLTVETKIKQQCIVRWRNNVDNILMTATFDVPVISITQLTATYNGDYIYVNESFNENDLTVKIEYNYTEYNRTLSPVEYTLNSTTISKLGLNTFVLTEHVQRHNNEQTTFVVPGIRVVKELRATYTGLPISLTDSIRPENILVELDTVNRDGEDLTTTVLSYSPDIITLPNGDKYTNNYYIEENFTVTKVGNNVFTIHYIDPTCDLRAYVYIEGKPLIIKFGAAYVGATKHVGDTIFKSEIEAYVEILYDVKSNLIIEQDVLPDDYEFYDTNIVQDFDNGRVRLRHIASDIITFIKVSYDIPKTLRLRCWYEGGKIKVGNAFNKNDVWVYIEQDNGVVTLADLYNIVFLDDCIVKDNGWNLFRVRLKSNKYATGVFAVPGYIPLSKSEKRDLSVLYYNTSIQDYEDVTEVFKNCFELDGILVMSWEQFLQCVNDNLNKYGTYIVTIPRHSGFSNQYDQDWEVVCLNKNTIKATIIYTYNEEDETWLQREQYKKLTRWWQTPNNP